jgi:hypothetical protein
MGAGEESGMRGVEEGRAGSWRGKWDERGGVGQGGAAEESWMRGVE